MLLISAGATEGHFEGKTPQEGHQGGLVFFVRRGDHCCRGDLVARKIFCFFFECLQKLEQRAEKCIELRGEYVEQIPSLFAVPCFLPGRAKDLSASPRMQFFFLHGDLEEAINIFGEHVIGYSEKKYI